MEDNYQPVRSNRKIKAAVIGGAVMNATSVIPYLSMINCACCAGIMLGGLAAVYFYLRDQPKDDPPLETKYGVILGAFAGIFGAIFETTITSIIISMYSADYFQGVLDEFQRSIENMETNGQAVPEILNSVKDAFTAFVNEIKNNGFSPVLTLLMLVFNSFKDIIFGLLGGLIGVYVLQKRTKQADMKGE